MGMGEGWKVGLRLVLEKQKEKEGWNRVMRMARSATRRELIVRAWRERRDMDGPVLRFVGIRSSSSLLFWS